MSHAVGTRRDSAHTLRAPHLDAYPHALRQSRPWAWREDASSRTPYRLSLWLRPLCLRRSRVSWPQGPGLRTDAALSSFPRPQVALPIGQFSTPQANGTGRALRGHMAISPP
jgi:hypothetical protein